MAIQKLLLDTNIIVDFLKRREPHFDKCRLLMLGGRVGEFSLWISASQMTDLVYILSNGGNKKALPDTLEKLRMLRTFIHVCAVDDSDVDAMLATTWDDPEDALLVGVALKIHADAIITRDRGFLTTEMVRVHDCPGFFEWLESEMGISYDDVDV